MRPALGLSFLFSSILLSPVSAQEVIIPLYLESLANGKTDTLVVGITPGGYIGCDYQNVDAEPVFDPFPDKEDHIGAYVTPGRTWNQPEWCYTPDCMVFYKRGVNKNIQGLFLYDVHFIVPTEALPVIFRWNRSLLPCRTVLNDRDEAESWIEPPVPPENSKAYYGTDIRMDQVDICVFYPLPPVINDSSPLWRPSLHVGIPDSIYYQTFVFDSLGERHGYRNFYVSIDLRVDNQALQEGSTGIRILSNPVKDVLKWESSSPLESWRVLDVSGRVVGNGGGDCRILDVSSLPPGLYLFSGLARNGRTETVKFVKR